MVFSLAPDDGLALTLRGVGTPARPQALDQSIALFLDGTYLAKGPLYPIALFDVERVEVVRGPHSTEVGKNASVGALSVVSREPGGTNAVDGTGSWDVERGGYALEGRCRSAARSRTARYGWPACISIGTVGFAMAQRETTGPKTSDSGVRLTLRSRLTDQLSSVLRYQFSDHERLGNAMQLVGPPGSVPAGAGDSTLDDHSFAFTPRGPEGESTPRYACPHRQRTLRLQCGRLTTGCRKPPGSTSMASTLDDIDFSASANVDFLRVADLSPALPGTAGRVARGWKPRVPGGRVLSAAAAGTRSRPSTGTCPAFRPGHPLEGQLFNGPFTNDFDQDTRSAGGVC